MYYNGEDVLKKRLEIRDNIAKSLGVESGYDEIEKARNVGDIHPNGKLVWTEYKPGKFDWRKNGSAGKKTSTASRGGQRKSSKSKKENKPKYTESIHSYLNNPKFDLSEDQKKVVVHLNEKLKSLMGINESNISLGDIQEAMGWDKNKTHDIVEALVSKEVLEKKVVSAMDGKDYKTYHFKGQDNMVYEPSKEEASKKSKAGSVPSELKTGDILIDFDIEGRVESVTRVTQTGRSKDGKLKGFNSENKRTKDTSNFQGYTINKDGTLSDGAEYGEDSMKTMLFHPNTDYRDVINASRKKLGMKPLTNLKPLTEKDLLKELGEDGENAKERSATSGANVLSAIAGGMGKKKVDSSRLSSKDIEALISEFEEMKVKMSQMQSMIDKIIGE